MADEDLDAEVQQHDSAPTPETESGALPSDAPTESVADAPADADASAEAGADGSDEPPALAPGGQRFKQVYARAKSAEAKLQELREEKARLEGQLEATRTAPPVPEPTVAPRLTWEQLEAGIDEGKITRAKAMEYDRESLKQELETKFEQKLREERQSGERSKTVSGELSEYKKALPSILDRTTPERQKLEREFGYLVSLGYDAKDMRTELLACRSAFGDARQIKEKQLAATIPNGRGTMQDIATTGKPKADAKDPLKTITGEQRKYYQRMIDKGQYKGWADVRAELEYTPKR